jgi:hypothetical protein
VKNKKLRLKITYQPENLPDDFDFVNNSWGIFELNIETESSQSENLLTVEWHMNHVMTWLLDQYFHVAYEILYGRIEEENIAQSIKRLFRAENLSDKERMKLLNYTQKHKISYGFPSMPIPQIFIGYRGERYGEISLVDDINLQAPHIGKVQYKLGNWAYSFDTDDFLRKMLWEIKHFLEIWLSFDVPDEQKSSANLLMETCLRHVKFMK